MSAVCWSCLKTKRVPRITKKGNRSRIRKEAITPGQTCDKCLNKWPKHRPSDASDMTLEELIASQKSGSVPGSEYLDKHELPRGVYNSDRGGLSF